MVLMKMNDLDLVENVVVIFHEGDTLVVKSTND